MVSPPIFVAILGVGCGLTAQLHGFVTLAKKSQNWSLGGQIQA